MKMMFMQLAVISIIVILLLWDQDHKQKRIRKRKRVHESSLSGHEFVQYIINSHGRNSYDLLRMRNDVFLELCELLKREGLLHATQHVSTEKQVAIFLNTEGHSERNQVMQI